MEGDFVNLKLSSPTQEDAGVYSEQELDNKDRQYDWEIGKIDYMGVDRYENIQKQLDKVISGNGKDDKMPVESTTKADHKSPPKK